MWIGIILFIVGAILICGFFSFMCCRRHAQTAQLDTKPVPMPAYHGPMPPAATSYQPFYAGATSSAQTQSKGSEAGQRMLKPLGWHDSKGQRDSTSGSPSNLNLDPTDYTRNHSCVPAHLREPRTAHATDRQDKLYFASLRVDLHSLSHAQGSPVGASSVYAGPVRVLQSVKAADTLQKGDILVTVCTDKSWEPYIPLVSGIVTEFGGPFSHAATMAKENGIPCIAGAENATQIFQTGEMAILDGIKGTLKRAEGA
ncbi:unnamed protein product [Cyprideis torosa]|uniref:PEP-utilising enzyme mobile domain-containing protein n=1 Tax=Cyprideis torosa TaxID=163714 RepID=A0A7R8WDR2_9CRUS|nr:unnamed protein product [Cyprideis torosa]CAG0894985.1 unnamed protein product [Cyprideis torosa]